MYIVSAVIIAGIGSLTSRGLNMGIEFTGGTTFDITLAEEVNTDDVRSALSLAFTEDELLAIL